MWFGTVDVPEEGRVGRRHQYAMTTDGSPLPGEADCIEVAADEQVTVAIAAQPEGPRLRHGARQPAGVREGGGSRGGVHHRGSFRFDLARGVDQAQRIMLSIGLLIAGLGLPMLFLLVIDALTARFQTLDVVRGTALPVVVSDKTISRADGAYKRGLTLRDGDFESLAAAGSDRRFTFGGVEFRARASRNPFGATIAMAAPEGGAEKLKGKAGSRVELDPGLAGSWVFLLDADRTRAASRGEVEGLLIAFIAEGDTSAQTARMLPDIQDRLPATAIRLAALVRQTAPKAPSKRSRHQAEDTATADAEGDSTEDSTEVEPKPLTRLWPTGSPPRRPPPIPTPSPPTRPPTNRSTRPRRPHPSGTAGRHTSIPVGSMRLLLRRKTERFRRRLHPRLLRRPQAPAAEPAADAVGSARGHGADAGCGQRQARRPARGGAARPGTTRASTTVAAGYSDESTATIDSSPALVAAR